MTVLTVRPRRSVGFDSFVDLTDVAVTEIQQVSGGQIRVMFAADLAPEVEALVRARMDSVDAADEIARADLADIAGRCQEYVDTHPDNTTAAALAMRGIAAGLNYLLRPTQ